MIVHASANSSQGTEATTYAVALHAETEEVLLALEKNLYLDGIPHHAFREPDCNNELMAIGISPATDPRTFRKHLKNFRMLA